MARAIADVYEPFARTARLPSSNLPRHPDTKAIVDGADIERLRAEIEEAGPTIVVSLGEAAFAVMQRLLDRPEPRRLPRDESYGKGISVRIKNQDALWYPLIHPGQRRAPWRPWHDRWMQYPR
jgi:hypothetical protein